MTNQEAANLIGQWARADFEEFRLTPERHDAIDLAIAALKSHGSLVAALVAIKEKATNQGPLTAQDQLWEIWSMAGAEIEKARGEKPEAFSCARPKGD